VRNLARQRTGTAAGIFEVWVVTVEVLDDHMAVGKKWDIGTTQRHLYISCKNFKSFSNQSQVNKMLLTGNKNISFAISLSEPIIGCADVVSRIVRGHRSQYQSIWLGC